MAWTKTLSTVTPAGSDSPRGGDDRIRELKAALVERLDADHYWPLSTNQVSDVEAGEHRKMTIRTLSVADIAALDAGKAYLYRAEADGELYFQDGAGNTKQLTSGGTINIANADLALITAFTLAVNFPAGLTVGQDTDIGNYNLRAKSLESDVATGTAPLVVASTTKVANLNAEQVDGFDSDNMLGSRTTVDTVGGTLAHTNVYRAQCNGILTVMGPQDNDYTITVYVDPATDPPTTVHARAQVSGISANEYRTVSVWVGKNEYVKVGYDQSSVTMFWRPFGGTGGLVKQA